MWCLQGKFGAGVPLGLPLTFPLTAPPITFLALFPPPRPSPSSFPGGRKQKKTHPLSSLSYPHSFFSPYLLPSPSLSSLCLDLVLGWGTWTSMPVAETL